jgi:hypothetical protein
MSKVEEMSKDLKEMWQDVGGNLLLPADFCVFYLWKKNDKKVSFKDCLTAYKMAI